MHEQIDSYILLNRDDDVFPEISKVLQRLQTVLFMLGSLQKIFEIMYHTIAIHQHCTQNCYRLDEGRNRMKSEFQKSVHRAIIILYYIKMTSTCNLDHTHNHDNTYRDS